MKHIILGAGGSIGNALSDVLLSNNEYIRLVSRRAEPRKGAESFKADLLSFNETFGAIKDADIVYLTAGLPYKTEVWQRDWHRIMKNTIDACKKAEAKFIFFDNVYMYGLVEGKMTESTPYYPSSKKGEVRAKIAQMLEDEYKSGNINASIARAADLYGPYMEQNSVLHQLAINKMIKGKKAQWLADANKIHSFTYTLDSAKALYLLSKDDTSFNQIWHLPTCNPALTGKEYIELTAQITGSKPDYSVLKRWMTEIAGIFSPIIKEVKEMLYQNEFDYYFDSSKFENYFNFKPTDYKNGLKETIEFINKN